jgi:hypothetical protein
VQADLGSGSSAHSRPRAGNGTNGLTWPAIRLKLARRNDAASELNGSCWTSEARTAACGERVHNPAAWNPPCLPRPAAPWRSP